MAVPGSADQPSFSYFLWLPLPGDGHTDRIAASPAREHVSVSTAEPFATSAHAPQAIAWPRGPQTYLHSLRAALSKVRRVVEGDAYR